MKTWQKVLAFLVIVVITTLSVYAILRHTGVIHEHRYHSEKHEATCTENGYTTYLCDECGKTYIDNDVQALGHSVVSSTTKEGYNLHTCERCSRSYKLEYTSSLLLSSMIRLENGDVIITGVQKDDVVIQYVDPYTGAWTSNGVNLEEIGSNQYRLVIEEPLWSMSADITISLKGNSNYDIITWEPHYE